MRFDKLTIKAQEALQEAQRLSEQYRHPAIDCEHLLLALVQQEWRRCAVAAAETGRDAAHH